MAIDLITGHQGVSHISADQIATINNAMMDNFGANKVMRLVGGELTADGLTITISEGYWRVNGFDMEIQEGETLYIDPTTIGLSRIDDIYVEILQDIPTGAQRAEIYIALGEPSATPTAPDEPTAPYLNTDILLQIIKLARVTVSEGAMIMEDYSVAYNIVTPEDLNTVDVKASSALSSATNALGMIQDDSDAYSSSKSYKVGDYVVHEDKIYKCITACSAAAWSVNQNCFEETTLTTAVTELNSDLSRQVLYTNSAGYSKATYLNTLYTFMNDNNFEKLSIIFHNIYGGQSYKTIYKPVRNYQGYVFTATYTTAAALAVETIEAKPASGSKAYLYSGGNISDVSTQSITKCELVLN